MQHYNDKLARLINYAESKALGPDPEYPWYGVYNHILSLIAHADPEISVYPQPRFASNLVNTV